MTKLEYINPENGARPDDAFSAPVQVAADKAVPPGGPMEGPAARGKDAKRKPPARDNLLERRAGARRSWELPSGTTGPQRDDLATDIMNIMEQGILVWSADGYCEMHNTRVFGVLELAKGALEIGTQREAFRARALERNELDPETDAYSQAQIVAHQPYSYDRRLPSGRVVLTNGRPMRGGGYVVTFTDVTEARAAERALYDAQQLAEAARLQAVEVLENERARRNDSKLLTNLDEWLQSCKSLDELFLIVRRFMGRLLPGSEGELYVYSNSRDALEGMCQWNTDTMNTHIAADACWALRRGRAYHYSPDQVSFLCDHLGDAGVTDDSDSLRYICVPIMAHGDTIGLLHLRLAEQSNGDLSDPLSFAVQCGEHISMAIANVKLRDELHDQSIRDALTGLFNRRHFMKTLRYELAAAARTGSALSLISFDADKFKSFNDMHGHEAGDLVLSTIGRTLDATLDGRGVGCRVGGEEFAVLVQGANLDEAAEIAEELRIAIRNAQVSYLNGTLPQITVSLGVATYPDNGTEPHILMRRGDEALYRAKDEGRNCVRLAQ